MLFILEKEDVSPNSDNSMLIAILAELQKANDNLEALNGDIPRFRYSTSNSFTIQPSIPTQLVARENTSRRLTISNLGPGKVWLLHGVDNPTLEQILDSPLGLEPKEMGVDNLDGGYPVWCTSSLQSVVKIMIEYPESKSAAN